MEFQLYTSKKQRKLPSIPRNKYIHDPSLYIPSEGLINSVNVALALRTTSTHYGRTKAQVRHVLLII